MALLYHITPNRALFSVIYSGVLCYSACVSIKSVDYSSSLPLCASSIFDLPVAVPAGAPEEYVINAEEEIQFLPQGPPVIVKKISLPKTIDISLVALRRTITCTIAGRYEHHYTTKAG